MRLMEEMTMKTSQNLQEMEKSISSMMALLNEMKAVLSTNFEWMMGRLGGAEEGLHVLITLGYHAAFLFLTALSLVFVSAPGVARVALLVMVTINALMEIQFHWSLSFTTMGTVQSLFLIGRFSD